MKKARDELDERAREMFKRVGICLLDVQAIEKFLALLLWPSRVAHLKPLSPEEFAKLDEELWSMSMGRLQRLFEGRFKDQSLLEEFTKVKEARDYFIHLFFIEAVSRGPITDASIEEIEQLISRVNELHTMFLSFAQRLKPLIPQEESRFLSQLPDLYQKAVRAKQKL